MNATSALKIFKMGSLDARRITLCSAFIALVPTSVMAGDIWLHMLTPNADVTGTRYLGDKFNNGNPWYLQYEIGQVSWNVSDAGIGPSNTDTTGWNWDAANWYENGEESNKKVQRDIGSVRLTSVGTWYFCGRAKADSIDPWHYANSSYWDHSSTFSPSYSFSVSALNTPSDQTATPNATNPDTKIDLGWTRGTSGIDKDTIILRKTSAITTGPTQGIPYNVNDTIDGATVIYRGNGTAFTDTVSAGITYYYAFYAENYSYYSAGVTAGATTTSSGVDLRAYQAADGVYVEFAAYDVEADGTIMLALVGGNGQTLWSGTVDVTAGPQAIARFPVPGLTLGQSYDFLVRDEVGKWWEANGVTVGTFNSEMTSATLTGITITFDSLPGHGYAILWTPELGGEWQTVTNLTAIANKSSLVVAYPDGGEGGGGFFRVQAQ